MEKIIKKIVLGLGADACGIADIDRFDADPWEMHPANIFPAARSVVVFLRRLPRSFVLSDSLAAYQQAMEVADSELDRISFQASLDIESMGAGAMPVPAGRPLEQYNEHGKLGRGLINLAHAAVYAGLGVHGRGTMLINGRFGNFVNVGAVITNLNLQPDPMCNGTCLPDCRLCEENCPVHALGNFKLNAESCLNFSMGRAPDGSEVILCNRCRVICPLAVGRY